MDIIQFIQKRIYKIRGEKVLVDRDLATLYHLEIDSFRNTVKQNEQRFPEGSLLKLTKKELEDLKPLIAAFLQNTASQTAIQNEESNLPLVTYAFTDQAITILGGIFNNSIVIKLNIAIMQALG